MVFIVTDFYTYEFIEEEGVIVSVFNTKTGTKYRVYFYPAKDYFPYLKEDSVIFLYGYFFGFTKIGEDEFKKENFDCKIKNTIISIVKEFYSTEDDKPILIFQCSDIDGKNNKQKRANIFDIWFKWADSENYFRKENEQIVVNEYIGLDGKLETEKEYLSLIVRNNNVIIDQAINEFQELKETLTSNKTV